jgi:hypothetical protein
LPTTERRTRRSDDTITALHYQLASMRRQGELEALVLVDDSGCLVAGAGAWPTCEELAAYAPLLARPSEVRSQVVGSRVAALHRDVLVQPLRVDGVEVLLCGRGGSADRARVVDRAAAGCRRILEQPSRSVSC